MDAGWIDARELARRTGWHVHHHPLLASTNAEAARLREEGAPVRTVVVADTQRSGRGRGDHAWASPEGGLYASLLVAARPADLPGPLTVAVAVACAEAVHRVAGVACLVKWPNDLWIGRRKVGGILLHASSRHALVVAGVGLNLAVVPESLPPDVRAGTTSLDREAGHAVDRHRLLEALLPSLDLRVEGLAIPGGRQALEIEWRARLALMGEEVTYELAGRRRRGRLVDASLDRGVLLEDEEEGAVWRRGEHVQEVRPAG